MRWKRSLQNEIKSKKKKKREIKSQKKLIEILTYEVCTKELLASFVKMSSYLIYTFHIIILTPQEPFVEAERCFHI